MNKINLFPKLILLTFVIFLLKIESTTVPTNKMFFESKKAFAATNIQTSPYNKTSEGPKSISYQIEAKKIDREATLKKFLQKYNSPLVENSKTFVEIADKYSIDYRILPSISCIESGCGKVLIEGNYNPFGWGKGRIKFNSYDESIIKVGKGLDEIYLSRGLTTVEKIAPVYNPPIPVTWTQKVNFFMNQIKKYELET